MIIPDYYKSIFEFLQKEFGNLPIKAALVLGSGLGDFDQNFNQRTSIFTKDIPNYPVSTVQGHSGKITLCEQEGQNYLVFSGRVHPYEGYSIDRLVLNVAISHSFSIKKIILTNAAGGISPEFIPGDLMLIDDIYLLHFPKQFRFLGYNYIKRPALSKEINDYFFDIFEKSMLNIKRGVYGYMLGPTYETPAEIRALWNQGCDAVGMSTVPEILLAKKYEIDVIAISAITNFAAGLRDEKITHDHVQDIAKKIKDKFSSLLKIILNNL